MDVMFNFGGQMFQIQYDMLKGLREARGFEILGRMI